MTMSVELGSALLDGVAAFAGTFTNPVAALAVAALGWLLRSRTVYRLTGLALGLGLALPDALSAGHPVLAAGHLLGGALGVLLQVEFMLGVVLPVLAFLRRVANGILGLFRTPTLPPGP